MPDLQDLFNRLAEQTLEQATRRRFFARLGTAALGVAGFLIGERLTMGTVEAASLYCCTGSTCPSHPPGECPSGSHGGYYWGCCYHTNNTFWICLDCFHNSNNGYLCTIPAEYSTRC